MKKTRILALLLSMAMLSSTAMPGTLAISSAIDGAPEYECGFEYEHTHDETCLDAELICTKDESIVHIHEADCYTTEIVMNCDLTEEPHECTEECEEYCEITVDHVHGDGCPTEIKEKLICELEETDPHIHENTCYSEAVLDCGYAEEHTHTTECLRDEDTDISFFDMLTECSDFSVFSEMILGEENREELETLTNDEIIQLIEQTELLFAAEDLMVLEEIYTKLYGLPAAPVREGIEQGEYCGKCLNTLEECTCCVYCGANAEEVHFHNCVTNCTCGTMDDLHAEDCLVLCECDYTDEQHKEECPLYDSLSAQNGIYATLMAAETVEEMYMKVLDLMSNDLETLMALSADEITDLRNRINELDPEGDDTDTQDLLDTLAVLPNGGEKLTGDPSVLPDEVVINSGNWTTGATIKTDTIWTFADGAVVTMPKPIVVESGATLTLKGNGTYSRSSDNKEELFIIRTGGTLVIEGSSKYEPLVIDGKNVIAEKSLITSSGKLDFENAVIQNGKNRAQKSTGGGIKINEGGSMDLKSCTISGNTAKQFGGGIYCANGTMTINNSVISRNTAATDSDEATNLGRGGGFEVTGSKASCTLNDTIVEGNQALYYGGGGQVDNYATITMNDGTIFRNNKAVLHGAGALHLTADAKFIMNGGCMEENFAQYCGGAIHSSYSCVLELNAGEVKNNVTNGRGGGIHINTGGAITLNEKITISGNKAYNKTTGNYANVTDTGEIIPESIGYEASSSDFGYGGGILIDSGTCTVDGATITGNYAEVGGGGIALTMLNMGEGGLDDFMVISFAMTSGTVANNKTDGNGAGVYIMTNKAEGNLKEVFPENATEKNYQWALTQITNTNKHGFTGTDIINGIPAAVVSGGTIQNNTATNNGGGLYLGENTKFIISGGSISANKAVDGAGVYVASGVAEINGGAMNSNDASSEGGALYIKGNVTMTGGTIGGNTDTDANIAVNGGAMYVTNGNVTIKHGAINRNKAVGSGDPQDTSNNTGRGGAVYLAGDTGTKLIMESGTMNHNTATNDGGAIFATGGEIQIGLEECSTEKAGTECDHHTKLGEGRHHPEINDNKADDTGGGIALTKGTVYFYCGEAKENQALYKGVGMNVFMDGGDFYLYDGADVGVPRDPDLVIVGGNLYNMIEKEQMITLNYYKTNDSTEKAMTGLARYDEFMNLPDGKYYWPKYENEEDVVFLGWTAQGKDSGDHNEYVRNKEHYVGSGEPVHILDNIPTYDKPDDELGAKTYENTVRMWDGKQDNTIHLYAIWAPKTSQITYVNGLTGEYIQCTDTELNNPEDYDFNRESNKIRIQPVKHKGYDLVGWYIYQNADQNANWNDTQEEYVDGKYEPNDTGTDYSTLKTYLELESRNSVLELEAGCTNFGNITLIAWFEPAFTSLNIVKKVVGDVDENQTFLFHITGSPANKELPEVDMSVTIAGEDEILIQELPVGKYEITEMTNWSGRYGETTVVETTGNVYSIEDNKSNKISVEAESAEVQYEVTFTNTLTETKWLDGNAFINNIFKPCAAAVAKIWDNNG